MFSTFRVYISSCSTFFETFENKAPFLTLFLFHAISLWLIRKTENEEKKNLVEKRNNLEPSIGKGVCKFIHSFVFEYFCYIHVLLLSSFQKLFLIEPVPTVWTKKKTCIEDRREFRFWCFIKMERKKETFLQVWCGKWAVFIKSGKKNERTNWKNLFEGRLHD